MRHCIVVMGFDCKRVPSGHIGNWAELDIDKKPPEPKFERGYGVLFTDQITQANEGCDFAFLAKQGRNVDPNAG